MELVRIPIQELEKVWGVVEKDIKNALAYSSQLTDSDFVYDLLKEGKFQLWILWDRKQKLTTNKYFGVVVTELIKRKFGKVCHIYIMTGRQRHKWQHLISKIEDFDTGEKQQAFKRLCVNNPVIVEKILKQVITERDTLLKESYKGEATEDKEKLDKLVDEGKKILANTKTKKTKKARKAKKA